MKVIKLISKKMMLSLGICTGLLTSNMFTSSVNAEQVYTSVTHEQAVNHMNAFEKLTPERQQQAYAEAKRTIAARMDKDIQQASTPEQKKQLEALKQENLARIDSLTKMTPKERKAFNEQTLKQIDAATKEQRVPLTPEQLTPERKADIIARAKAALKESNKQQEQK